MKKFAAICLMLVLVLTLIACKADQVTLYGAYVYEKGGFSGMEGDNFILYFNEDGTFTYTEGWASSHFAIRENCSWTLEDDILTLSEIGSNFTWINYFRVDGNSLCFQEENSTGFIYTDLADGDRFVATETVEFKGIE